MIDTAHHLSSSYSQGRSTYSSSLTATLISLLSLSAGPSTTIVYTLPQPSLHPRL